MSQAVPIVRVDVPSVRVRVGVGSVLCFGEECSKPLQRFSDTLRYTPFRISCGSQSVCSMVLHVVLVQSRGALFAATRKLVARMHVVLVLCRRAAPSTGDLSFSWWPLVLTVPSPSIWILECPSRRSLL